METYDLRTRERGGRTRGAMEYHKFGWHLQYNAEQERFDGTVLGASQELPFHGKSVEELKANFRATVDRHLARCAEKALPPYRSYSGKLHLRLDPELHRRAAFAADAQEKSLNQWIEDTLSQALARKAAK